MPEEELATCSTNLAPRGMLKIGGKFTPHLCQYVADEAELASLPLPNGKLGMLAFHSKLASLPHPKGGKRHTRQRRRRKK
jgi:hypothetical protein